MILFLYILDEIFESINFNVIGASVLMAWQANIPGLEKYLVEIQNIGSLISNTHTISIEVPGTVSEVHFSLLPDQNYSYCISAVYTHAQQTRRASACNFIVVSSLPSSATEMPSSAFASETGSCQTALVGGVLGLVTVLLVLLLLLALVYPRCRARMKDKKYLSK